jgi:hypothetical protein
MGFLEWLLKRIDKPADQSFLLREGRDAGSERAVAAGREHGTAGRGRASGR